MPFNYLIQLVRFGDPPSEAIQMDDLNAWSRIEKILNLICRSEGYASCQFEFRGTPQDAYLGRGNIVHAHHQLRPLAKDRKACSHKVRSKPQHANDNHELGRGGPESLSSPPHVFAGRTPNTDHLPEHEPSRNCEKKDDQCACTMHPKSMRGHVVLCRLARHHKQHGEDDARHPVSDT